MEGLAWPFWIRRKANSSITTSKEIRVILPSRQRRVIVPFIAFMKISRAIYGLIPIGEVPFVLTRKKRPIKNTLYRGLEIIKSSDPDLIILDYMLSNTNGLEICKELRTINKFKDIPLIPASSTPLEKELDREMVFKEAGFDFSFSKPLNAQEFREIVKNLLFI